MSLLLNFSELLLKNNVEKKKLFFCQINVMYNTTSIWRSLLWLWWFSFLKGFVDKKRCRAWEMWRRQSIYNCWNTVCSIVLKVGKESRKRKFVQTRSTLFFGFLNEVLLNIKTIFSCGLHYRNWNLFGVCLQIDQTSQLFCLYLTKVIASKTHAVLCIAHINMYVDALCILFVGQIKKLDSTAYSCLHLTLN